MYPLLWLKTSTSTCRVTPGFGADSHARLPTSRLMSADLPTLGNPTTTARTGRGCRPRDSRLRLTLAAARNAVSITCREYESE